MLQSLSIGAGGGSIASLERGARRAAGGRPEERRLLPRPGRLPARRHRADRDRRQPRARLPVAGRVLRRPHAARQGGRGGGDQDDDRRPARRLHRRGGGADPADHRRQDGVGDPQGGDAARLPADGLHAVRVRRRRADPRRRLHGRDPARGDVPVLAGVLRVRLVDHGRRPPLRALAPDDAAGAAHGPARARPRGVQRDRARADGRGPARGRGRGPELGRRDGVASSSTASTAARSTPSGRRRRCCSWNPTTTCARSTSASSRSSARRSARSRSTCRAASTSTRSCCGSRSRASSSSCPSWRWPTSDATPAGTRQAYFDGWVDTPVYEFEALQPGHSISGPAIVQAAYTTAVIPPGRRFHIENHGLGILEDD